MSLKDSFEAHPMLLTVGAVSLILNALTLVLSGYSALAGERPAISEKYVFTPLRTSEADIFSGKLKSLDCPVLHNEVRLAYTKIVVHGREMRQPQSINSVIPRGAILSGTLDGDGEAIRVDHTDVFYLVIQNVGSAVARDLVIHQNSMVNPRVETKSTDPPVVAGQKPGTVYEPASVYDLVGKEPMVLIDKNSKDSQVCVGALNPGACLAIPIAMVDRNIRTGQPLMMVSDALIGPVNHVYKLSYKRAFGFISEVMKPRPLNSHPIQIAPMTFAAG